MAVFRDNQLSMDGDKKMADKKGDLGELLVEDMDDDDDDDDDGCIEDDISEKAQAMVVAVGEVPRHTPKTKKIFWPTIEGEYLKTEKV